MQGCGKSTRARDRPMTRTYVMLGGCSARTDEAPERAHKLQEQVIVCRVNA